MTKIENMKQAAEAMPALRRFIGQAQILTMADICRSEERKFMYQKMSEILTTIETMPKTYETDGQGEEAIA